MGGEGSAMSANTSLKNNRSMLKKRKDKSVLGGSYAHVELKEFPEATEADLKEIKERILRQNSATRRRQFILFLIIFTVILTGLVYILI